MGERLGIPVPYREGGLSRGGVQQPIVLRGNLRRGEGGGVHVEGQKGESEGREKHSSAKHSGLGEKQ